MRVGRYINEVCALFDVNVIIDIDASLEAITDGYKVTHESPGENYQGSKPIKISVALGVRSEYSAGESGYVMTKWFADENELDEFCELNINRFRIAASACAKGADTPDAREWR
jgi:hypothetical protein